MFEDVLARVEASVDIPYPERALLLEELAGDLEAAYRALRARGVPEGEAVQAAAHELELDAAALASLEAVHLPAVRRALARLPAAGRGWLEALANALPPAATLFFIAKEVPMIEFLREGGFVIYLILGVAALALLLELHRAVLWFVLRDHSPKALRRNTATPLYLAAAVLCLGLGGTALDYYVVFRRFAGGGLSEEALRVGLREPLPPLIVAGALGALVVLLHGALNAGLRRIRVPAGPAELQGG
jgi:hypothetical protein